MNGILNINKPAGMTSFGVVARVRRLTDTKKVGHAGTLDPDAEGVLPICVGKATKIIEFLMDKDKAYRVGLVLGKATDTQDASGKVLYEREVLASTDEIINVIKGFIGSISQIPPMYSAVHVNGKRLYDLARQGIEVERKPRSIIIHGIDILDITRHNGFVSITMDVECSKGTYIRTLCHDIGEKLKCGGFMASLLRTRSGPFTIQDSITLDELIKLKENNLLEKSMLSLDSAIEYFPKIYVSDSNSKKLKNGLSVVLDNIESGLIRVYHQNGAFLAIGKCINLDGVRALKTYKWIGCHE